jgi:heme-degrading monooxygenase HmoA
MLCALSVRQLKPGTYDQFREAWQPDEWAEGFVRAYHLRSLNDENHVISFGFFDGSLEDLQSARERQGEMEERRQRRMAEVVESTRVDGIFEVVEEVTPAAG